MGAGVCNELWTVRRQSFIDQTQHASGQEIPPSDLAELLNPQCCYLCGDAFSSCACGAITRPQLMLLMSLIPVVLAADWYFDDDEDS